MRPILLASLALLGACVLNAPRAHAGVLICKSHYTDSHDRLRLRAALEEVLPPGVSAEAVPDVCRNRGSARAWLRTWSRLRSDGVTEWWEVACQRAKNDWTCETPAHRQLIWVYADVGGVFRRLEVSFDDATDLARARVLAVHAWRIIEDPSSTPVSACGSKSDIEGRREWEKVQRASALTPKDTVLELSVESDASGGVDVITHGDEGLGLHFTDGSDASPSKRPCWTEWVVVG
jgi:hypothetical protein